MATPKKKEIANPMELWGGILSAKGHDDTDYDMEDDGFWIERPVDPETFVSSSDYLGIKTSWSPALSERQREFMEVVGDFENGKKEIIGWIGKGGGKNFVSCVAFAYLVYKLLCMRNPNKYLNRSPVKAMTLLNVAINATQGIDNFFTPLSNMLRGAGDKAFRQFGFDPEKDILTKKITFPKSIQIISGHSSSGGVEG